MSNSNTPIESAQKVITKIFQTLFCTDLSTDLSIVTGSSNQDQTLTNELFYFDGSNLLSSTVITIENKTERKIEKLIGTRLYN